MGRFRPNSACYHAAQTISQPFWGPKYFGNTVPYSRHGIVVTPSSFEARLGIVHYWRFSEFSWFFDRHSCLKLLDISNSGVLNKKTGSRSRIAQIEARVIREHVTRKV